MPLGPIASDAATILRGKHKAIFAPHVDTGDFVSVINAGKVSLSGSKRQQIATIGVKLSSLCNSV
jgi:large subunit ribosomal protein L13